MSLAIEITVKSSCPIRCGFCPQDKLAANYKGPAKEFTLVNFALVLEKIPKDCVVHFSGFVEPFTNHWTPAFIRMAKEGGREVHLYTTLVGIDKVGAEHISATPPDYTRIHVPDQKAMLIPDDKWIGLHQIWFKYSGTPATYMSMGPRTPAVQEYLDSLHITVDEPTMLSRGGNLANVPVRKITGRLRCAMDRWHQNVILPNGNVYGCCADYGLKNYVGNLFIEPYQAIWDRAEAFSKNHNPPDDSICRTCEWATGF